MRVVLQIKRFQFVGIWKLSAETGVWGKKLGFVQGCTCTFSFPGWPFFFITFSLAINRTLPYPTRHMCQNVKKNKFGARTQK